jgi:hypothetical protein
LTYEHQRGITVHKVQVGKKEFELLKDQKVGLCANCQSFVWCEIEPEAEGKNCDSCLAKNAVYGVDRAVKLDMIEVMGKKNYVFI